MQEKARELAGLLKVLANENRLMVFCALMQRDRSVGELAGFVPGITQSALSQHLALLKAHGVLDCRRAGQTITYFISDHRVEALIQVLKQYYCDQA